MKTLVDTDTECPHCKQCPFCNGEGTKVTADGKYRCPRCRGRGRVWMDGKR